MKLYVRTDNARRLGNGLVAHVRNVQAHIKKHGKPPQKRYLTYAELIKKTEASMIERGIGSFLDQIMAAIHGPGVPDAMRGLTLFVTDRSGRINYDGNMARWPEVNAQTSLPLRNAVLAHDWTDVEFLSQGG